MSQCLSPDCQQPARPGSNFCEIHRPRSTMSDRHDESLPVAVEAPAPRHHSGGWRERSIGCISAVIFGALFVYVIRLLPDRLGRWVTYAALGFIGIGVVLGVVLAVV